MKDTAENWTHWWEGRILCLGPMGIHQLHQAFKRVVQEQSSPVDGVGRLWRLEGKDKVLQPGEIVCMKATDKLTWDQPGPFVILETELNQVK